MLSSKDYCGALVVMSVVCVRLVCVYCVMFCACIVYVSAVAFLPV